MDEQIPARTEHQPNKVILAWNKPTCSAGRLDRLIKKNRGLTGELFFFAYETVLMCL